MPCRICKTDINPIFKRRILQKHNVEYYQCPTCGLIQTENPYWLDEAYQNPIADEDTGILARNILFSLRTEFIIRFYLDADAEFLDYGGGYGIFVRLMRDKGYNFFWDDKYTKNLFALNFSLDGEKEFEAVSSFECFEHFSNPMDEMIRLLSFSDNIIFSTELYSGNFPQPDKWDYYSFESGQHISLYSEQTLRYIAEKFGLNLYSNHKSFHFFTRKHINKRLFEAGLKLAGAGLIDALPGAPDSLTLRDMITIKDKKKGV